MISVWNISVLVLGVLLRMRPSTAAGGCEGVSREVLNLLSTFNGRYSNCNQWAEGQGEHDLVQVKAIPLHLRNLSQDPLLYVEQATNGVVDVLILGSVIEKENGIYSLIPHIFTNGTRFRYDEYNVHSLSSLTPADLQTFTACAPIIQQLGNGNYLINWPDCTSTINGHNPTFSFVLSCHRMHVVMPAGGPITPVPVPYILKRFGDRYPVPDAPNDYASPCWGK